MGSLVLHVELSLQHVESLVVACWIFLIVTGWILLIVTGRIFIVAWNLLNCGMWDLFCSMRDLFLFSSMWDLELQHADLINCRMYDLCCSMQDLFISGMWEVLVVA